MKISIKKLSLTYLTFSFLMITAPWAHASPPVVTYPMIPVGTPENSSDQSTGFGAVSEPYTIGEYDVTIGQYTAFLNEIAQTDTYGLYNSSMTNVLNTAGITRSGSNGSYEYTVMNNSGDSSNRPITNISWFNAARFANWMANGQPQGGCETSATTENGAYDLSVADGLYAQNKSTELRGKYGCVEYVKSPTSSSSSSLKDMPQAVIAPAKNTENPNTHSAPTYYIPTENQWYKAAYYNQCAGGSYSLYATHSNETPGNSVGDENNQANYLSESTGYSVTQSKNFSASQNYLTDVGAFPNSSSFYGTFDQTGNIWEWNDLDGTASASKGLRGGAYTSTPPYLKSTYRMGYLATRYNPNGGFRLAGAEGICAGQLCSKSKLILVC